MRGCADARMRGCPDARMPGCPDARMPGCPDARMPGCPGPATCTCSPTWQISSFRQEAKNAASKPETSACSTWGPGERGHLLHGAKFLSDHFTTHVTGRQAAIYANGIMVILSRGYWSAALAPDPSMERSRARGVPRSRQASFVLLGGGDAMTERTRDSSSRAPGVVGWPRSIVPHSLMLLWRFACHTQNAVEVPVGHFLHNHSTLVGFILAPSLASLWGEPAMSQRPRSAGERPCGEGRGSPPTARGEQNSPARGRARHHRGSGPPAPAEPSGDSGSIQHLDCSLRRDSKPQPRTELPPQL
ncbi:uncharacterized protein LOC112482314 [Pteropus alecto]|uniref:uncharacterized protein LOC112482314 n=1 Tax=Pteropus alecto TaxID=9402 RepID=UPI000D531D69|nr:uncharacterized protein LOC112482314 [Pteropus alecto]